jgi:hypothetical protein
MDELVTDALLAQLRRQRTTAPNEWRDAGLVKKLHGAYSDFYENLFIVDDVQQRPMGFMGPGRQEYTVLAYATHKQRRYDPAGVFETLSPRREQVMQFGGCKRVIKLD